MSSRKKDQDEHEAALLGVMSRVAKAQGADLLADGRLVYRADGYTTVEHRNPLSELLAKEDGPVMEEAEIRTEAFRALMDFLFADGPHPGVVVRRVYALAKAICPARLAYMSLADLGLMLGETRAAQSWRVKKIFSYKLQAAGAKATHAAFQKRAGAVAKYAAAQKGNTNRKGRRKRAAA